MATTVVNKNKESFDEYIGRPTIYGNPYVLGRDGNRTKVIELFRAYFEKRIAQDLRFKRQVLRLKGLRLGCHCAPQACHGDVYVDYLENKRLF